MTKKFLELGIYIAIITILLGILAIINTFANNSYRTNSFNLEDQEKQQLQNL